MPGITLLNWPPEDLRDAIVGYIQKRGSFAAVSSETGDVILAVKSWLILRAPDRYIYTLHLEADLSKAGQAPMKTYVAEAEAVGSSVRWVTASDEEPINIATGTALQQLLSQIESDGALLEPHTSATINSRIMSSSKLTDDSASGLRASCCVLQTACADFIGSRIPPTGDAVRQMGTIGPRRAVARLTSLHTMPPIKSYSRTHFRVPLSYPVMFSGIPFVGEAQLCNLTVFGCGMNCGWEVPLGAHLKLRLLLPDQSGSLGVEIAAVRWTDGMHAGLEFLDLAPNSRHRLHSFVLDEFSRVLKRSKGGEPSSQGLTG
ncbi:MAG TPA: PilZ domain-containing protein [Nitrospiraceae bacterium]|nr:PilZ domain-containing protein [Nitrospiraceae bacterium]